MAGLRTDVEYGGMEYTTLGRTGLRVSVAGLGCGGFSRLGISTGGTEAEAVGIVRLALDSGINVIDTAAQYGTETIVGQAIRDVPRDQVVVATKCLANTEGVAITAAALIESMENSLRQLGTDHIDVFQLHAVYPHQYDAAMTDLLPALVRAREQGKVRFLGLTEAGETDQHHDMLRRAAGDGVWDTGMVAYNMLHRTAAEHLFPHTLGAGMGILVMHAVRSIFARPPFLAATIRALVAEGKLSPALAEQEGPLDFLVHEGGASSVTEAAYRFARHSDGVDVVLFGTGSASHLRANVAALSRPALPAADVAELLALFAEVSGLGLERPGAAQLGMPAAGAKP